MVARRQQDKSAKKDLAGFRQALGKGYGEIAAESRSQHKSQGFGVARQRGAAPEYFTLWKGDAIHSDLMENVNTAWTRVQLGNLYFNSKQLDNAETEYKHALADFPNYLHALAGLAPVPATG